MKALALSLCFATLAAGCATSQEWSVSGGKGADRVVRVAYATSDLANPPISDRKAGRLAARQCDLNGYSGTENEIRGTLQCTSGSQDNACSSWRVEHEYQCSGNVEASAATQLSSTVRMDPYAVRQR